MFLKIYNTFCKGIQVLFCKVSLCNATVIL